MVYFAMGIAIFVVMFVAYAMVMRRREAIARRAWQLYCDQQALANDAARAALRVAREN